jgi:hypothetical protein
MGVNWSLCLLLKREHILSGLPQLAMYELTEQGMAMPDPYFYINNSKGSLADTITKVNTFVDLIHTPEPTDPSHDTLATTYLRKNGEHVVLWFTPWMQRIFSVTEQGVYSVVELGYSPNKNMSFIPPDHPVLSFLEEIVTILQPIYGWTEGDFTGSPKAYFEEDNPSPTEQAPWHVLAGTQILSKPLISYVERIKPLSTFDFREFKKLSENLFWMTWPGTAVHPSSKIPYYYDPESEAYKAHFSASLELLEILKTIPASILETTK